MRSIPPRVRAPIGMILGGAVVAAVAAVAYGWGTVLYLGPVTLAAAAGYYAWAGRDSDMAAVLRRQSDERQAYRQLKIQALVGRVMSVTAAVAFLVAVAVKATLWPFAIFLAVLPLAVLAGWVMYRERGGGREHQAGH